MNEFISSLSVDLFNKVKFMAHEKINVVENPDNDVSIRFEYRGYMVQHVTLPEFGVLKWMFEPLDKSSDIEREWRTSEELVIEAIDSYEDEY
jgi:hypothetical protein